VAIKPGGRGQFLVRADGRAVAEKDENGFPDEAAVVAKLRAGAV
jgi:predicted Rdx family selenoprotein